MKILNLPLKAKWYKMIESGIKTEEYREIKPYWIKRFCFASKTYECCEKTEECGSCFSHSDYFGCYVCYPYSHVRFRYGYTKRTMLREIESITFGFGNPEWGAPKDKQVFIIKFKPNENN